ncbi:Lrp/AsnC family transcriptional regulator [Haloarchaeobius litoreus]|uniref:Winged helix-turn-helix transcriptional regulator n=1 Tax=Haloarchaeobius litoreus TaxID=755306 RepID=A0ABD6DKM1_9EURY|nr:TrkA C-terminal domain-containing protein [Haloarchaeobius litoreus]
MDYRLDEIDKRILYHLALEARDTSAPDIAEEVNVSAGTIRNRINQLEERGIIRGYHADIDYELAEGMLTNRFKCTSAAADRAKLAKQILQIPGVVNIREIMTGKADLEIKAVGSDTRDLTRIGDAILELGVEIEDQDIIKREHFRPFQPYGPVETRHSPSITDFMSLAGDAEVVELTVREGAPITGTTLREANSDGLLEEGLLVVALERDGEVLTPHGETRLEPGDLITIFVHNGQSDRIESVFAPQEA